MMMKNTNRIDMYVIQCVACEIFRPVKRESVQKWENSFQFTTHYLTINAYCSPQLTNKLEIKKNCNQLKLDKHMNSFSAK